VKIFNIFILIAFSVSVFFISGCQTMKYDSYDAEKYAENNLDIEVKSIFCTSEEGFEGSERYNLDSDDREICFILGSEQNTEYVYSYGSKRNTKLIQNEPSIASSDLIEHFDDYDIEILYWKYIYQTDIELLGYYITTNDYEEIFVYSDNDEFIYYINTSEFGFIRTSMEELTDDE